MSELTDDRLRELVAKCDGPIPGPWERRHDDEVWSSASRYVATAGFTAGWQPGTASVQADFIATCDPDTIRALASELLKLREAVKPFAALGQYILDEDLQTKPDDRAIWGFDRNELTYGDFRRAAKAIGASNV